MITRWIELCARHRALVLLLALALAAVGVHATRTVTLDAIPDLSDPQVVVFAEWSGRAPTLVEEQVTWPLVSGLLGAPQVVDVRAQSMFGMSFVYVVFEDGADLDRARARVLERLSTLGARLPQDARVSLGPDASGVGWVYQYALVDRSGSNDLASLRVWHDTTLRPALTAVRGVVEVATVGGYEPQFQVVVDPVRLQSRGLTLFDVAEAVRQSSGEVGGRVIELSQREHFVRGRGFVTRREDLEQVPLRVAAGATPVVLRDVASVQVGAELRRGLAELDGEGEVVSGIVVMGHGENARAVIERVRATLDGLRPSLPRGVTVRAVYDRASLIDRAIATLRHALLEEMLVVALVIVGFLLHLRSALLPIVSLPLAVVLAFIPMRLLGIPATILSLGGIAIALGATVDAEIVMVEAAHKHLEGAPDDEPPEARRHRLAESAREVTPAIFTSLLIVAASFIPVFGLGGAAGRMFRPLAFTKTFVMLAAALLSITVAPALRDILLRGKMIPESRHPVSRAVRAVYAPFVHAALRNPWSTVMIGLMAVLSALPLAQGLGREFMPALDEGDMLYMPTTLPNLSIDEARRQLQRQDAILRAVPEVESVLGKAGRADTATDPAPLSMFETVVKLRPRARWRTSYVRRWYVGVAPAFARPWLQRVWPEFVPMTREALVADIASRMRMPGWSQAYTQPIRNRIDMQATGIRTPVGVKVHAHSLDEIEPVGVALERALAAVPGTRGVYYERNVGGRTVDIEPDRAAMARAGVSVEALNTVIEAALGAQPLTSTLIGRRRWNIALRLPESLRDGVGALESLRVPAPGEGRSLPLGSLARVVVRDGPPMVRDEGGTLAGYVYVDLDESQDPGRVVDACRRAVDDAQRTGALHLPTGVWLQWTGQYEQMIETTARLKLLVPLSLLLVAVLLYLQFRDLTEVVIVLLSVPFALVGSVWMLYLLDYRVSTAVWVGVIALVGLATQTGVVMIVYIDQAYRRRLDAGLIRTRDDIVEAHAEGTIQRVRPKLMTVGTMLTGLAPLLWSDGTGAEVMKRIAAPMVGGLLSSAFLTLEVIPVVYTAWREEQRIARALATVSPSRAQAMARWSNASRALCGLAVAAAIAPVWAPVSGARWWTVVAITAGLAAGAILGYGVVRRAGCRALDAAAQSQGEQE